MLLASAIRFIEENGNPIDKAYLAYLLSGQPISNKIISEFFSSQNQDGSWSPFWASDYSSLDATCFHLSQAYQLGISMSDPKTIKAFAFIADHQNDDGFWEEEQYVTEKVPPWLKPGELSAKLYLTANCGYWLAITATYNSLVQRAAKFLASNLAKSGKLSSFKQAEWLSAGIWYQIGMMKEANQAIKHLEIILDDFSANNLTWMISALRIAKVPANYMIIAEAADKLILKQKSTGQWPSDDGPGYDVHTTLEALYALKQCGRM
jgi:hypothetical protein